MAAFARATIERETVSMKQPLGDQHVTPPLPQIPVSPVDTATLELLAAWKAEDATTDADKLREADEEIAEFKKAMNENRKMVGARPHFP